MTQPRHTLIATLGVAGLLVVQACADGSTDPHPAAPGAVALVAGEGVLVGAGNIATCGNTRDEATADLLDNIPGTVVALGDNAFPSGTLADYINCYGPSWGRHKSRTYAALGNHEYGAGNADGTFDYFGDRAGPRGLGYYSFDVGSWHVIVLNDQRTFVPFGAGSAQEQWLLNDLAANPRTCILAMWHVPLYHSSNTAGFTSSPSRRILWEHLYAAGADVVLNGQEHHYERLAPMRPDGTPDDATGIREFVVGTGGESVALPTVAIHPASEVRGATFGVLKLTLVENGYSWEFVPVAGQTFSDRGEARCSGAPPAPAPNEAPVAAAGGPYRSEDRVTFDGGRSSDPDGDTPLSFAWDFGDGASGTGVAPEHRYAADGTYTVTLTVTDARGAVSAPAQTTATIANLPPSVSAGPDRTTLPGLVTLRATFSDPGAGDAPWSYTITWGDGLSTSGTASSQGEISATHPYVLPGSYRVRVRVTDKDGGSGEDEAVVTVRIL